MNKINQLELQDAIYIAGLFDGEGSVNLSKSGTVKKRWKTKTYTLRARIRMTDEFVVRWIHATVGGRFYTVKNPARLKQYPHGKLCYEWNVAGVNAVNFLRQIYPYLKVKRLQADVAFKYGRTLYKRVGGIRERLSDEIISKREVLRSEMLLLNNSVNRSLN